MKNSSYKKGSYNSWRGMISRCTNPNDKRYYDYGGRGIFVCDEWLNSFENFYNDMGEKPEGMSIDRINNNDGYYKENCKWSTQKEQSRNMRSNNIIEYMGESKCVTDWASDIKVDGSTIQTRISRGWSIDEALNKVVRNVRRKIYVLYDGKNKSAVEWADEFGLSHRTFRRKLRDGWTMNQISGREPKNGKYYIPPNKNKENVERRGRWGFIPKISIDNY